MRSLDQIKVCPRPDDKFEHGGLVYEVLGLHDGGVVYRVDQVRKRKAHWMTMASWRALVGENFSQAWEEVT